MIIVNFKTYLSATGKQALVLAKLHEAVAKLTEADVRIAVQALDLSAITNAVSIPVYAQHVDAAGVGNFTGAVAPEAVRAAGGRGTILNHSEKRLPPDVLRESVAAAKKAGLTVVLCAATPEEGAAFLDMEPDFIAVEPPELIGGAVSVSTARPEVIEKAAKLIGSDKLLVGAGVKNGEDVRTALRLGARGVLLASGVTKAKDPKAVLLDLVSGLH